MINVTHPDPDHDCDGVSIADWSVAEVILPAFRKGEQARRAFSIDVHGRNLRAVAQPLVVFVGGAQVQYLRIAPDERSVEGILLEEPEPGATVTVWLGEDDVARHPRPFDPGSVQRIDD